MKININGKVVEVDNATITEALEKKQEEIIITDVPYVIRTTDEDKQFQENLKKETMKSGTEIGRKEILKGLGIEKDGIHKSDESTITALQEWSSGLVASKLEEAKIEPNKKVDELNKDLETLKGTIKTVQQEKEQVLNEYTTFKKSNIINTTLSSVIPDNIVLYNSYNKWEVFFFDERGNRNDVKEFDSEIEACEHIYKLFKESKAIEGKYLK